MHRVTDTAVLFRLRFARSILCPLLPEICSAMVREHGRVVVVYVCMVMYDVYLGILAHRLHNLTVESWPPDARTESLNRTLSTVFVCPV